MRMKWSLVIPLACAVAVAACGDEPKDTEDADDPSGGSGASATGGSAGAGAAPTGGTAQTGGAATGGATPSGGATAGGVGGASGSGLGGSGNAGAGGGSAAAWTCEVAEANGNCYCSHMPGGPLSACPPSWPCCVQFQSGPDDALQDYCACEGIESSAECDSIAGALLNGMRVANCPP